MPKKKDFGFEEEEESTPLNLGEDTPEVFVEKVAAKVPDKPKQKFKVLSISKNFIYMSHTLGGIEYGISFPLSDVESDDKFKSVKAGDIIYL